MAADRIGERIREGRVDVGQPVGDLEEVLQRDLRDRDRLGVGALVVEAHQLAVGAQVLVARPAQAAAAAPERRDAVDAVAEVETRLGNLLGRRRPDLDQLAADLVAEHPGRGDAPVAVVERPHVRAADAAGGDTEEDAVLGTGRVRDVADGHLPGPVPDRRAHPAVGYRSCLTTSGAP